MARASRISIRYAELNGTPRTLRVKAGMKVSEFAEREDVPVSDLFINGKKERGSYVLQKNDFVVVVSKISGGK